VRVGPGHVRIDEVVRAVALGELACDDRHLLRDLADDGVPAGLATADGRLVYVH
jgi:hypothetical protein